MAGWKVQEHFETNQSCSDQKAMATAKWLDWVSQVSRMLKKCGIMTWSRYYVAERVGEVLQEYTEVPS